MKKHLPLSRRQLLSAAGAAGAALVLPSADAVAAIVNTGDPGYGFHLEDVASNWGIYVDPPGRHVSYSKQTVSNPSLDGSALAFSIGGGDVYTGVQVARQVAAVPTATAFQLSFFWRFSPGTTWNSRGGPSVIQAVELAINQWTSRGRYERCVQWDNVLGDDPTADPTWRVWTGSAWQDTGFTQRLDGDTWYYFELQGNIRNGQTRYIRLTSGSESRALGQAFPPTGLTGNGLTAAFQLDGNCIQQAYTCYFDHVSLL